MSSAPGQGPLAGLRVVEMDGIGPVPLAGMMLADMGADVVRVARPPASGKATWTDVGGAVLHRSRAVTYLDLKQTVDRDALLDLVAHADGLIEGFRPGVMERLGLRPEPCMARNPALVFGRMTGWGQTGPLAPRAGHDLNYISITGALHAMGDGVSPPPVPLNLVGDYGGGTAFLMIGVLAALHSARKTGQGQVVDACITDGVSTMMSLFHAWQASGFWVDAPASNLLDGAAPFYRCYRCADGRDVAVACLEPAFFGQMLAGLGLTDRGYDQPDRARWPEMASDFAAVFATRTRGEWDAVFAGTDACVSPVLSMSEAPTHPQNRARASLFWSRNFTEPAPAPRFGATPSAIRVSGEVAVGDLLARWR